MKQLKTPRLLRLSSYSYISMILYILFIKIANTPAKATATLLTPSHHPSAVQTCTSVQCRWNPERGWLYHRGGGPHPSIPEPLRENSVCRHSHRQAAPDPRILLAAEAQPGDPLGLW